MKNNPCYNEALIPIDVTKSGTYDDDDDAFIMLQKSALKVMK